MNRPVNHHEVKDALEDLNTRKATGYDGLQPRISKLIAEELAPSLTRILNTSIEQGTWLSDWKRGEWVPVHKSNNREELKNYRPITVLPTLDKLFEKLLGYSVRSKVKLTRTSYSLCRLFTDALLENKLSSSGLEKESAERPSSTFTCGSWMGSTRKLTIHQMDERRTSTCSSS